MKKEEEEKKEKETFEIYVDLKNSATNERIMLRFSGIIKAS